MPAKRPIGQTYTGGIDDVPLYYEEVNADDSTPVPVEPPSDGSVYRQEVNVDDEPTGVLIEPGSDETSDQGDSVRDERDQPSFGDAGDEGGVPLSSVDGEPPSSVGDNPDDGASDDPLVNINANLVQLIRLLHATDERRDRHIRRRDCILERQIGATQQLSDAFRSVGGDIRHFSWIIDRHLNHQPSKATRLRRWIHRKTADR